MPIWISPSKRMGEVALNWKADSGDAGDPLKMRDPHPGRVLHCPEAHAEVLETFRGLSAEERAALWGAAPNLVAQNEARITAWWDTAERPAILSFQGLQFQSMRLDELNEEALSFLQRELLILSALYGPLSPLDPIRPYRLDVGDALRLGSKPLTAFWSEIIRAYFRDSKDVTFLNLCSKEYAACLQGLRSDGCVIVDVLFYTRKKGRLVQASTLAKQARGAFVHHLAQWGRLDLEAARCFSDFGLCFQAELSDARRWVFVQES